MELDWKEWGEFERQFFALQKKVKEEKERAEKERKEKAVSKPITPKMFEQMMKNRGSVDVEKEAQRKEYEALKKKVSEMEQELVRQKQVIQDLVNAAHTATKETKRISDIEKMMKKFDQDKVYWCLSPRDVLWENTPMGGYKGFFK